MTNHIQSEMKKHAQEVWVPEPSKVKNPNNLEYPKCNIFMSADFYSPKKTNSEKTALVLI